MSGTPGGGDSGAGGAGSGRRSSGSGSLPARRPGEGSVAAAGRQAASWLREERAQAQSQLGGRDPYGTRRPSGTPVGASGERQTRQGWPTGERYSGAGPLPSKDETLLTSTILALDSIPPPSQWPAALLNIFVVQPTVRVMQAIIAFVTSPRTHRIVLRLSVLTTLLWTALFLAMIAYVGFVRVWLPQVGLRKTVWLQYGESRPPYAHLSFLPGASSQRFYHSSISEEALNSRGHFFADDQAYDVTLELQVPLTAANVDLGNFMATIDLRNEKNNTVWKISRPAILLQEPLPIRALSTLSLFLSRNPPALGSSSRSFRSLMAGSDPSADDDDDEDDHSSGSSSLLPSFLSSTSSFSWSIPTQLVTIPLLRRKVLQPSRPTLAFLEPASDGKGSSGGRGYGSNRVTHGMITVGRADADRYWYVAAASASGGGAGSGSQLGFSGSNGGMDGIWATSSAARSRGELQTHSASLRFDAHLTGIRYIMYHHPIISFLVFTSLFFAFEVITGATLWLLATLYTSETLSSSLRPRLEVEESYVEGVRRGQQRTRRDQLRGGDDDDATATQTPTGDDDDLTETEDGYTMRGSTRRRWSASGDIDVDDTDDQTTDGEQQSGAGGAYAGSRGEQSAPSREQGLRRRTSGPTSGTSEEDVTARWGGRSEAEAARQRQEAAAASLRRHEEEERAEAEGARDRRDTMAGRRMTEITGSDLTRAGGPSASSPMGMPSPGQMMAGTSPGESMVDPFLDIMPSSTRRILSRLDEETEEETVSGSTDAASTIDGASERGDPTPPEASGSRTAAKGDDDDDAAEEESVAGRTATVGGSETSRGSSAARSFGISTAPSISTVSEDVRTPVGRSGRGGASSPTSPTSASQQTPRAEALEPLQMRRSQSGDSGAEADED